MASICLFHLGGFVKAIFLTKTVMINKAGSASVSNRGLKIVTAPPVGPTRNHHNIKYKPNRSKSGKSLFIKLFSIKDQSNKGKQQVGAKYK